jgi:hypothetical protein
MARLKGTKWIRGVEAHSGGSGGVGVGQWRYWSVSCYVNLLGSVTLHSYTAFILRTNYVQQIEHAALSCSKSVNCVHMYRSASDNRVSLTSLRSSRVKLSPLQRGHNPCLRSVTAFEWRSPSKGPSRSRAFRYSSSQRLTIFCSNRQGNMV